MLKSIAVYRNASKLSQPLNSALDMELDTDILLEDKDTQQPKLLRKKLPNQRRGLTHEATIGHEKIYLRTGEYEDGTLGEIFIDMYKEGSGFRGLLGSFAVLVSKSLQYGVPLEELIDTFTLTKFEPQGIVRGNAGIPFASSVLDYVFKVLEQDYIKKSNTNYKDNTLYPYYNKVTDNNPKSNQRDVSSQDNKASIIDNLIAEASNINDIEKILSTPFVPFSASVDFVKNNIFNTITDMNIIGYTGEMCPVCQSLRVRLNGTCLLCDDCGATTGCS